MKTIIILLLFFCNSLQAQQSLSNSTSENQLNYIKSHPENFLNWNGNKMIQDSIGTDFLSYVNLNGTGGGFGWKVSSAGDVNGDGYDDVIVGSNGYPKVFIYFGGVILDSIADVVLSETSGYSGGFGSSVSGAGDLNGDGFDDVIIGKSQYTYNHGRAYIYFGSSNMDNIADLILEVSDPYGSAAFGSSLSSVGDVNGDGFPDVIVGDNNYDGIHGRAYIYYGGIIMNNIPDVILDKSNSYIYFASSVSGAGDLNGDGYDDVIISADPTSSIGFGVALIYYGAQNMSNYERLKFTCSSDNCSSVSSAGDVNGDGYDDVIIGESRNSNNTGKANILFGGVNMDNISDLALFGEHTNAYFGNSVSKAGDLNNDGYDDFIVGSYKYNGAGKVYGYYGGIIMNNNPGLTLNSESSESYFGRCVSNAGDVNNDGYDDIIIGADGYDAGKGKAYVYFNSILINPQNNSSFNPQTINFKWKKVNSAVSYILQISADSTFNSMFVNDTITIDTFKTVSGFQKETKYFWRVITNDTLSSHYYSAVWNFRTIPPLKLNLKALMEGIYYPLFNLMSRRDTVKIYLHQTTSPYNIIDSSKSVIDSLTFRGVFKFYNAAPGTYFLAFKHFNSIETWSKSGGVPMTLTDTAFYDFTISISQAYGNNLKLKGGKYCIYGGNVNGDAIVDGSDLSEVDNDSFAGLTGRFLRSDVNGDNIVDAADVSLVDNNSYNSVVRIRP